MTRQQQRNEAIRCAKAKSLLDRNIKPVFSWSLISALFGERLKTKTPLEQANEIVDNRALFGEVLVALYDYNVEGFACIESGRGELFISALSEVRK